MLTNIEIQIPKYTDTQVFKKIDSAINNSNLRLLRFELFFIGLKEKKEYDNFETTLTNTEIKECLEENSELIKQFDFILGIENTSFIIQIIRNQSDFHDKIFIQLSSLSDNYFRNINKLNSSIRHEFNPINSTKYITDILGQDLKSHYQSRENELTKLQNIVESLISKQANYLQRKEDEILKKKEDLDKEHQVKIAKTESELTALKEKFELEKKQFEEKVKQFDDRESKHVRRKIREDLKQQFKHRSETFELTKGTQKLRTPVLFISILILIFLATLFAYNSYISTQELLKNNTFNFVLITITIKQVLIGLALGSTSIFLIRWTNRWFEQHAKEEFRLKRHELDIDRASWLVELAFEWKSEKGEQIPDILIERLSQNLFTEEKKEEVQLHPSEQLASAIFGAASSASIKVPGGTEVNLDRKGIKSLNNK